MAVGLHHLSFHTFLLCEEPNHINFEVLSSRISLLIKHLFIVYYLQEFPPRASTPSITTNIKTNTNINIIFDPRASSLQRWIIWGLIIPPDQCPRENPSTAVTTQITTTIISSRRDWVRRRNGFRRISPTGTPASPAGRPALDPEPHPHPARTIRIRQSITCPWATGMSFLQGWGQWISKVASLVFRRLRRRRGMREESMEEERRMSFGDWWRVVEVRGSPLPTFSCTNLMSDNSG